jgi:hypothetical protein
MIRLMCSAAAVLILSFSPASADRQTLVYAAGPVPQGHPYLVQEDGVTIIYPVPRRPLQYGLIDGRRVLVDPLTNRIVYYLHP